MAAPSKAFQHLDLRFQELTQKFMAVQLTMEAANPLTFTPDTDLLAAFRLLVHAEIEDYLERKARDALSILKTAVATPGFSIKAWMELYVLAAAMEIKLPLNCPHDPRIFTEAANRVTSAIEKFIAENNGIKSQMFALVSVLCGRQADEIDPALATTLNQYGSARGDVAHISASRVRTISAPSVEFSNAEDLLENLGKHFNEGPNTVKRNVARRVVNFMNRVGANAMRRLRVRRGK
jgi:hypothetical protein